ncbi:MAG TPA: SpoIID/LytB domain-containing protein [Candidatus Saccharimonadales bacterium]|nr:SpoIID/LytB domain-containing protein [Candidatus Saccharimonadales bacterium]
MPKKLIILIIVLSFFALMRGPIKADELLDVQNQINKKNSELSTTQANLAKIQRDISSLSSNINGSQADLAKASAQASEVQKELDKAEDDLTQKRASLDYLINVRNKQIREVYQFPERTPLELFLSKGDLTGFSENLSYQSQVLGDSHKLIKTVNEEVVVLEKARNDVLKSKNDLDTLVASINSKLASLKSSYSGAVGQQAYLSNQTVKIKSSLGGLTTKQNQLIATKIGNSIATGSLALADDANARLSFNPGFSPAFAAFSFGAYTHRNGMSQYGALGRANSGQSAEQILAKYYPGTTLNKNYSIPGTIVVNGTNDYGQNFNNVTYGFNEYIKHLYEVPSSWPIEVLKAQAVAARSYAIRYGSPICPSQSCQEVKQEINASSWQSAVDATSNWVLTGGSGSFQYSSTSGGYLNTSGWDTTCGNISCWPSSAYESIGGSPWFYKGWYKSLGGATCGRSHPWLTQTEFTDILNSWVVYTRGSAADKARVVSTDTACWGGSPYSVSEMKARADALGGSYSSVSGNPVMTPDSGGFTSSMTFYTDRGGLTISGGAFKDIFNLRAPGYLVIKTPLYNIERK